jgi:hypothetical protein
MVEGRPQAILPLVRRAGRCESRLWSHVHGEYGGIIALRSHGASIVRECERYLRSKYPSLRLVNDPLMNQDPDNVFCSWKRIQTYTHVLSLELSYDHWFTNVIRAKCRNQIRNAAKHGVEVCVGKATTDIAAYYGLYVTAAAHWGVPAHARASEEYFYRLVDLTSARLYLARMGSTVIAGMITLECPEYVFYYRAALNREHTKACPTYALMDRLVRDSFEAERRYINMGASNNLGDIEAFKENFGAQRRYYDVLYTDTWSERAVGALRHYVVNAPTRIYNVSRRLHQAKAK